MKFIISLAAIIAFGFARSDPTSDLGQQKLAKIRALEAKSPNGIIIFSAENYR
jgi:hypothetical protein